MPATISLTASGDNGVGICVAETSVWDVGTATCAGALIAGRSDTITAISSTLTRYLTGDPLGIYFQNNIRDGLETTRKNGASKTFP